MATNHLDRIQKKIARGETTDMPGTDYPRPGYKITCAMEDAVVGRNGKETKLHRVGDYVRITKYNKGRKRYETDRDLQQALGGYVAEHGGDAEKPMRVPIFLTSDAIGDVLFRRMAMYRGGGQPVCTCSEFAVKDSIMLEDQDIPRPSKQDGNLGREYFAGVYTRRKYHPDTHDLVRTERGLCDPANCPFATGETDGYKEEFKSTYGYYPKSSKVGDIICRPQVIFTCVIAEIAQGRNPVAVLRSKSWNTGSQLAYWLKEIQDATGGILRGVPLWLALEFQQSSDRDGKTHTIPVWTLAVRQFGWPELPDIGTKIKQQRLQAAKYHHEAERLMEGDVKGLPAGQDFVEEFWPEIDDQDGETSPRELVTWLAEQLEWSDSEIQDLLDRCEETGEWDEAAEKLSRLAKQASTQGKAERLDAPAPAPEGEAVEDEPEPDGPPAIPCPDSLQGFPTSKQEWEDGLWACGWDADEYRHIDTAMSYVDGYDVIPEITDDTDPSTLWPIMLTINWYAHQHDLEDPLQPLFDDLGITYGDEPEPENEHDGGDGSEAGYTPENPGDDIQEGEFEEIDQADERDPLDQYRPDEIYSEDALTVAVDGWPMHEQVTAITSDAFPDGNYDAGDADDRWEIMKALHRHACHREDLDDPFPSIFRRELTEQLPLEGDDA